MYFLELSQQILREMRARKVRSILALLGIVWGTVAVVLLLAVGQGFYAASVSKMGSVASGAVMIMFGKASMPYHGLKTGRTIHVKAADILQIPRDLSLVQSVSPFLSTGKKNKISYNSERANSEVFGVAVAYASLTSMAINSGGRFINPIDIKNSNRVVFLGNRVKDKLFDSDDSPLNQQIIINNVPFTVIGWPQEDDDDGNSYRYYDYGIYIPYTTSILLWGNNDVSRFIVMPKDPAQTALMMTTLTNYLAHKFKFDVNDTSALIVFDAAKMAQFIFWFFRGIEIFLGFCGAMTLGVGGVGVANIMFLIVRERTAEIGLRMALGARASHIMLQVMLEAIIIVFLGGLIGFIFSGFILIILNSMTLPAWLGQPTLSAWLIVAIFIILSVVALTAGYFPARRAANMQPVEALGF